jgi:hypothetical protein
MKLSKYLFLMALSLSAAAHAQTSQTYHFGEGQTTLQHGGSTSSPPPLPGAQPIEPLPPGEPHPQAKPKPKSQPHATSKSKSKHKPHHRHQTTHQATHHTTHHTTHHSSLQDPYSHP